MHHDNQGHYVNLKGLITSAWTLSEELLRSSPGAAHLVMRQAAMDMDAMGGTGLSLLIL